MEPLVVADPVFRKRTPASDNEEVPTGSEDYRKRRSNGVPDAPCLELHPSEAAFRVTDKVNLPGVPPEESDAKWEEATVTGDGARDAITT